MKILHIVPKDGIGGVGIAARSAATKNPADISVLFLSGEPTQGGEASPAISHVGAASPVSPGALCAAVRQAPRANPDVIVASLWKTFSLCCC